MSRSDDIIDKKNVKKSSSDNSNTELRVNSDIDVNVLHAVEKYSVFKVNKNAIHTIEQHSSSKGVMPQLDLATFSSQIFWLVISFSILYLIIAKICVPSIMEVRINRKEKIDRDLDRADRFKEESIQIKEDYESFIKKSNIDAAKIIENAADSSSDKADEKIQSLEQSTARKIIEAEKNIEKLRVKAEKEISNFSVDLSIQIAEKISGVKIAKSKSLDIIK